MTDTVSTRLGRHQEHDPRSLQYPAARASAVKDVRWVYHGKILNQGDLGCHDEATDVLTADGWRRWSEYDGGTTLGTIHPITQALEFQEPSAVQRYDYAGPMLLVQNTTQNFSVTPNHRMWVRRWDERARTLRSEFTFVPMDGIGWYSGLVAAPSSYGGLGLREIVIGSYAMSGDDFVALLALVASDGWVGGTDHNRHRVSFCCFREDRYERVAALAHRLGFDEQPSRRGVWYANRPALADWLRANLYAGTVLRSPYKVLPSIVRSVDQRQADLFLEYYGDQHVTSEGRRNFTTTSGPMADGLQELLLRIGKRCGMYTRPARRSVMQDGRKVRGSHLEITLTEWTGDRLSIERKKQVETIDYEGAVYCATVPNGLLITRREGKVLISGNSCTGNAAAEVLMSGPYFEEKAERFTEKAALAIYELATRIDSIPGSYPPNDTGSSGLAVMKACVEKGYCRSYKHAFGLDHALGALMLGPLITGVPWLEDMFEPDPDGTVHAAGAVAGGHEFTVLGYDAENRRVRCLNHWTAEWGDKGYFWLSTDDWGKLLGQGGDVCVPVI